VPVIVTPEPATNAGVAVAVPPLATGKIPVTPVVKGKPVALVSVTDWGVPKIGVTSVGLVAKTLAPVPVSSVKAAAKLALVGVAKNVAIPVAKPETPVLIGKPVAFVNVPLEGVPKAPPFTTGAPAEPTLTANAVAIPVPSPATPVEIGSPVAFVKVPLEGVPKTPPLTTGAPAVPTLTANAVAIPVPNPETPVEIGKPVPDVNVTD